MNCAWFTIVDSKFLLEKQHYDINHLRKRERDQTQTVIQNYPGILSLLSISQIWNNYMEYAPANVYI